MPLTIPAFDDAAVALLCAEYGIASLDLFGSFARGEDREDSDVDLLYTLKPGARLGWEIADLEDKLSETLGRRVDLVSRRALHPMLRDSVLHEAVPLYGAH